MDDRKKLARITPDRSAPFEVVERRAAPRIAVELPICLRVASAADAVHGRSVNISKSGVFIATHHPPPIGTLIDIELELPDKKLLLHAKGQVMRHSPPGAPPGVGVAFTDISYEAQELLDELTKG